MRLLFHRKFEGGRVPYTIAAEFTQPERDVIAASIMDIEAVSCVRWVAREGNEQPFVHIKNDESGCFANVGTTFDGVLNLGSGCVVGTLMCSVVLNCVHLDIPSFSKPNRFVLKQRKSYIHNNKSLSLNETCVVGSAIGQLFSMRNCF